jgi:hypothetical protein
MAIKDSVTFTNLLSFDPVDQVVRRYAFTDGAGGNYVNMVPGIVVKFDASRATVLAALTADDAALEGIIVDIADNTDVPSGANTKTVAVAFTGAFDKAQIKYGNLAALSVAGIARLRALGIFLDAATPAGAFAP